MQDIKDEEAVVVSVLAGDASRVASRDGVGFGVVDAEDGGRRTGKCEVLEYRALGVDVAKEDMSTMYLNVVMGSSGAKPTGQSRLKDRSR